MLSLGLLTLGGCFVFLTSHVRLGKHWCAFLERKENNFDLSIQMQYYCILLSIELSKPLYLVFHGNMNMSILRPTGIITCKHACWEFIEK